MCTGAACDSWGRQLVIRTQKCGAQAAPAKLQATCPKYPRSYDTFSQISGSFIAAVTGQKAN